MTSKPNITFSVVQNFQQDFFLGKDDEIDVSPEMDANNQYQDIVLQSQQLQKQQSKFGDKNYLDTPLQISRKEQLLSKVLLNLTKGKKFYNNLKLKNNTKKFIKNLRNEARLYKIDELTEYHHNIVSDKTDYIQATISEEQYLQTIGQYQGSKTSQIINGIKSKFKIYTTKLMPNSLVINQFSTVYYVWQIIQFCLIILTLIQFPLVQTFGSKILENNCILQSWLFLVELIIFVLDLFFNCNVAFMVNGQLLTDRLSIMLRYANRELYIDILGLIGFMVQKESYLAFKCEIQPGIVQWLQYLFLFKALKLKKIFKKFEKLMNLSIEMRSYVNLIKLFFFIFMVAHFMCCLWYQYAMFTLKYYETNFLENVIDMDWHMHYLYSLYYILMTMTTICYGDLIPKNDLEKLALLFIMLLCSALFGYTLNSINQILDELKQNKETYQKQKSIILNYMKSRKINKDLQQRIKNYFKNAFKNGFYNNIEQEQAILQKLSLSLQEELIFDDKGKCLQNIPFFSNNFSQTFLRRLSHHVQELFYSSGDELQNQRNSQFSNNSFIYVSKGQVSLYAQNQQQQKLQILKEGQYFGLDNLMLSDYQPIQLKAEDFSIVYILQFEDFLNVLKEEEFNGDYEKYSMLKDEYLFANKKDGLEMKCWSCQKKDHYVVQCPLLTFIPNSKLIIGRCQYSQNNIRRKVSRKRNVKKRQQKVKVIDKQLTEQNYENIFDSNNSKMSQISQDFGDNRNRAYSITKQNDQIFGEIQQSQVFWDPEQLETQQDNQGKKESLKGFNLSLFIKSGFDLDRCNNFKNYYPDYNFEIVPKKIRRKKIKKRKQNYQSLRQIKKSAQELG